MRCGGGAYITEHLPLTAHTDPSGTMMRSALTILTVLSAVVAEAPYHLPRPAPHAPPFGYPSGPAPPPPPPPAPYPQLPVPRPTPITPFPHPPSAPQPLYSRPGYNYQQPSIGPAFVYPAPHPVPQPIPAYHPPPQVHYPAPQSLPQLISQPQPLPISYPQPQPAHYPQPQPQPLPVHYPQPQHSYPPPQVGYGLPQPLPQQPQTLPNFVNNSPAPIVPLPVPISPQPQDYQYQQSLLRQTQFAAPLPLQSQSLTNNAVSSYQADSNQYSSAQAQTHSEALDETVVNRVQNIIMENEHSSARNAGYLSLVSGVSLENAKPSVEISSFVHTSPENDSGAGLIDVRSASSGAELSSSSVSAASLSSNHNVPQTLAGSSQSSDNDASFGFLPNNKPGISYGAPN